jgi:hypothetical protein
MRDLCLWAFVLFTLLTSINLLAAGCFLWDLFRLWLARAYRWVVTFLEAKDYDNYGIQQ